MSRASNAHPNKSITEILLSGNDKHISNQIKSMSQNSSVENQKNKGKAPIGEVSHSEEGDKGFRLPVPGGVVRIQNGWIPAYLS